MAQLYILALALIGVVELGVHAQFLKGSDIVCMTGEYSKEITVGEGDSFSFKSQAGSTNCSVTYKKATSCSEMRFFCSQFKINNQNKICRRTDYLQIQANGKETAYCHTNVPDETTTGETMKVSFLSKKMKQGSTGKSKQKVSSFSGKSKQKVSSLSGKSKQKVSSLSEKSKQNSTAICRMECVSPSKTTDPSCLNKKTIGGKDYTLAGNSYKIISNCSSTCIYEKDDTSRSRVCFTKGDREVIIKEDDTTKQVLADLSRSNKTVYCCNNGTVTTTQCGGIEQQCQDACGDVTCVKFHPRPEEAGCYIGDNHMAVDVGDGVCKTRSCGQSCYCCLNRGYYLSCHSKLNPGIKPDLTCRCNCQCNKYKKEDICKMKLYCSQCRRYKNNCPSKPMSNTTEQETVGGTDTSTSTSSGETVCPGGSYEGIWPARIGAIISINNLENVIEENELQQNLVTWNPNTSEAFLALPEWKFVPGYSGWCSTCPGISLAGKWEYPEGTPVATYKDLKIDQCIDKCEKEMCKAANWNMATWDCVLIPQNTPIDIKFDAEKTQPLCALSQNLIF